jgi:hypothetical protein
VVGRAVHAFVQQRAAQQVIERAFARAIEAGQSRLAFERDVIDGRLAIAGARHAQPFHDVGQRLTQLLAGLAGPRLERGVGAQLEGGDAGRGRERVGVEGAGVGHALGPVPVGLAAEGHHRHDLALAAEGTAGQTPGHDLGQRGEIGRDAVVLLGPAGRIAEAGDHLVEDEHHPEACGDRAQLLQVPRNGGRGP